MARVSRLIHHLDAEPVRFADFGKERTSFGNMV